jgi:acyl carrier protein
VSEPSGPSNQPSHDGHYSICRKISGQFETFARMLPGMIEFHLPNGATKPPAELKDSLRLNQDLGLDSLALTEMAFKLDDLFGIPIETREVMGVETVRDLKSFLRRKLDPS